MNLYVLLVRVLVSYFFLSFDTKAKTRLDTVFFTKEHTEVTTKLVAPTIFLWGGNIA